MLRFFAFNSHAYLNKEFFKNNFKMYPASYDLFLCLHSCSEPSPGVISLKPEIFGWYFAWRGLWPVSSPRFLSGENVLT
jgi:hypothetical protein